MNIRKPVGQRAGSAGHAVSHFVNHLTLIHTIVILGMREPKIVLEGCVS